MSINPEKYSQQFTSAEVAFLSHLADLSYSEGDILYYHSGNLARLPIGSTNQVLTVISGDPSWQTAGATSSPLTTKGDVYVFSTINTRLAVGTDGQVLSADSSQATGLKWITVSGTGTVTSVTSATGEITIANTTTTPVLTMVSAPKLTIARTINGVSFDGTAGITVTAAAGTLTGTTLNSTVVTSSLTSVGTITTGVWTGTTIAIANGGTGQTTKTTAFDALQPMTTSGDIIYGGASGTGTRLAKGSDGQVLTLVSGLPAWQNASTGFTNPMTTLGDIIYEDASPTAARLAGNTTSTKKYLSQTGTGSISAVPAWAQIAAADIGSGAALTKTDDTNVTLTLGGTPATALLVAASLTLGWTGQLGLTRGGTAASLTASNGGIVYSTASALAILAGTATAGQILRSGASTTPSWSTATYPSVAGTSGNVLTSDGTNWISSAPTGGSGSATTKSINQNAHGFTVGQVLRLSGTSTYSTALADSVVDAEVVGMVSTVTDSNNFIITTEGYVSGLSGLTANTVYFLDPSSAGALTATEPSTIGQVSKPLFISDTTTSGYFYNFRGMLLSALANGTVTSVAMTVPSFLSISGSPITTSGTLAVTLSGTALPVANGGTGITSFGSGIATWLGTPSSANLAAAVTDETGTGALVFANTPTLVTAVLGSSTATTQSPSDNSTKVATTAYVDAAVLGQNFKEAALVATTANLVGVYLSGVFTYTATGTDSIDGVTLVLGNRVLVKNQTTTFQNGIYVVTTAGAIGVAGVLTRSSDANSSGEFKTGDSIFITSGTANSNTTWAYTGIDSPTIGTDAITYAQTAGQGTVTAGNGIAVTGLSVAIDTSVTVDKTTVQTLTNKTLTGNTAVNLISGSGTFVHNTTGTITAPNGTSTLAALSLNQTFTGINTFSPTARTSGAAAYLNINAASDTGIQANNEALGINFIGSTRTWADGTVTKQREILLQAPTYNKTTTSATFTTAATFSVSGAPSAGTGVTITNAYAILIEGNNSRIGGTAPLTLNSDVGGIGLELSGSNNTAGGMNLIFSNSNSGTSAFTSFFILNDSATSAGANYCNIGLNSSTYTDTTFGTIFAVANQFQIFSSVGSVAIGTTKASSFVNIVAGGSATTNEIARFTTTGMNIGLAGTLTGAISFQGSTSGSVKVQGVAVGGSAVNTLQAVTDTFVYKASTDTLTNKRITVRDTTTTQSATPTINTDNTDHSHITALAQAITSFTTNLSGTPVAGDTLWIDITDNGTARAITWGASFEASTVALPTTTVISTRLDVRFVWNEVTTKWRCVGVA